MGRKKNSEVIVQIIILLGIALLLAGGMLSGKVNYYIHPRYHIGIWVSIGILCLFVISLLTDLKKARHNVNLKPYMLFAIPILIAIVFPASGITKEEIVIAQGTTSVDSLNNNQTSYNDSTTEEEDDTVDYTNNPDNNLTSSYDTTDNYTGAQDSASSTSDEDVRTYDNMSEKYTGEVVDGATVITDDYFASWFYDMYDYLDDFVGKKYQYLAQVYPSTDFGKNRFLAGRYIMSAVPQMPQGSDSCVKVISPVN